MVVVRVKSNVEGNMERYEGIDTHTEEVTCICGHTWELTVRYDNHNGQTDYDNPLCPECQREVEW
jgi:hypothetical protein